MRPKDRAEDLHLLGTNVKDIATDIGYTLSSTHRLLRRLGYVPNMQRRLTLEERLDIIIRYKAGVIQEALAKQFNVAPSTIAQLLQSREVKIDMSPEQEVEILKLFGEGVRQAEIARRVGRSPSGICQFLKKRGIEPQPWPYVRAVPEDKTCLSCRETKPAAAFRSKKSVPDQLTSQCSDCMSKRERERWPDRYSSPEYKEYRREYELKQAFGMSVVEFDALLAVQGGHCKVCAVGISDTRWLCVDHVEEPWKVRGILCIPCNQLLGRLDACAAWPKNVASYIAR